MALREDKQAVSGFPAGTIADFGSKAPASGWFGNPLTAEQAATLADRARAEHQACLRGGKNGYRPQAIILLCRYWQDEDIDKPLSQLLSQATDAFEHGIVQLVYGQLLAARKRLPAMQQLEDGFIKVSRPLSSSDYFNVVRRHELLSWLKFSAQPSNSGTLDELLAEAAVIKQLQDGDGRARLSSHHDTVG